MSCSQNSISPGEEDYYLLAEASCCPIKGTLVWTHGDDQLWILQSKLTVLDGYKSELLASNCAFLIWWNHFLFWSAAWFILRAGNFYECGSIYNCLLSQERSLGVWELQFVWDNLLPLELFYLITKIFFFLVVHLNIIWHPCPLRRWITPIRGAKIGEVMFTILSLDLIGIIGRVSTLGKGWYVLTCVY